ncbi:MAG: hypothetical protein GY822_28960, partial [Deltaproteobacteria bacterium]|nr:hypothetical protein [Deltaproteobacteria bacterium]
MARKTTPVSKSAEESKTATLLAREVLELKKEKEELKKNHLAKLHGSLMTLILNASSGDDKRPAREVPDSCKRIYKCETAGLADQELTYQFQEKGLGDVSFAHGTIQALYNGSFLYSSHGTPNNFSAFSFSQRAPLQQNQDSHGVKLHLVTFLGKSQTLEEFLKSTKQSPTVPTKFHELGNQLTYFRGAVSSFFGDMSPLGKVIRHFTEEMEQNRQVFMDAAASDNLFCAKVLFEIDFRSQRWLGQCRDAKEDR